MHSIRSGGHFFPGRFPHGGARAVVLCLFLKTVSTSLLFVGNAKFSFVFENGRGLAVTGANICYERIPFRCTVQAAR